MAEKYSVDGIEIITEIVKPATERVATVSAWPGEVQVQIHTHEGNLSVEQAEELVQALTDAIKLAPRLDYPEAGDKLVLND